MAAGSARRAVWGVGVGVWRGVGRWRLGTVVLERRGEGCKAGRPGECDGVGGRDWGRMRGTGELTSFCADQRMAMMDVCMRQIPPHTRSRGAS